MPKYTTCREYAESTPEGQKILAENHIPWERERLFRELIEEIHSVSECEARRLPTGDWRS